MFSLRHRHDRRVGKTEVQSGVAAIQLNGSTQESGGQEVNLVLSAGQSAQECGRGVKAHACPQQLIHLHGNWKGYYESPSQLRDQRSG